MKTPQTLIQSNNRNCLVPHQITDFILRQLQFFCKLLGRQNVFLGLRDHDSWVGFIKSAFSRSQVGIVS